MKFQTNWTKHFGDIGMLESLFFILHNRRAVGKNFFDVTVGELKKCRKFETVLVTSSHCPLEENHSKSKVSTWSSPRTQNIKREWLIKWKGLLYALEALARLSRTHYGRQLRTKHCGNEFSWDTLSSFINLYSRKTRCRRFLIFPQKDAILQLYGKKKTGNKQIMPAE